MKASQVLNLAKTWVGKNESNGSFKEIIDVYNTQKPLPRGYKVKYTDEWCATFISALFVKLGATNLIATECSCQKMINGMASLGIWFENENMIPKVGDIVFYDWEDNGIGDNKGWADHVGIVESVNGNNFTVIEGNYSNSVKRRTLTVNQRYLRGFARPKYEAEVAVVPTTVTPKKSNEVIAQEVIQGKWGNGEDRKNRLVAAGYNYETIRNIVNQKVSAPKTNTASTTTKYKVTAKDGLRIRSGASTSSSIITAMPYGSIFTVTKTSNGWAYGTWNGKTGWSSLQYLIKC